MGSRLYFMGGAVSGLMVSVLDSGSSGPGSGPGARFSKVQGTLSRAHCTKKWREKRGF